MKNFRFGLDENKDRLVLIFVWFASTLYGVLTNIKRTPYFGPIYSTTSYAFSYRDYGIQSRMLLGTIYQELCIAIGISMDYRSLWYFMMILGLLMSLCFLLFAAYSIKKMDTPNRKRTVFIISIITIAVMVPSYLSGENFGKTDTFLFMMSMLQAYLIMEEKALPLIPFLSVLQVMTHEGYLCMTGCVPVCLLMYKAIRKPKGQKTKYWLLFTVNFIAICAPAVYFVFFKKTFDEQTWISAYELAKSLSMRGGAHISYINQRLNFNPHLIEPASDALLKKYEYYETPIFLLLFSPVLIHYLRAIKSLVKEKEGRKATIGTIIFAFVLVAVEYIIFCDFGRYLTWLIFFIWIFYIYKVVEKPDLAEHLYENASSLSLIPALVSFMVLLPIGSSKYSYLTARIVRLLKIVE